MSAEVHVCACVWCDMLLHACPHVPFPHIKQTVNSCTYLAMQQMPCRGTRDKNRATILLQSTSSSSSISSTFDIVHKQWQGTLSGEKTFHNTVFQRMK